MSQGKAPPFARGDRLVWRGRAGVIHLAENVCVVERVRREGDVWRVFARWPGGATIEAPSGNFIRAQEEAIA